MNNWLAIVAVLSNRNTRGLVLGTSISSAATATFNVVAAIFVTKATGSAMDLGAIFMIATLPLVVLSPIAGVVCDRFNRRMVYIMSDLSRGAFVLLLIPLFGRFELQHQVWLLYAAAFILSVIDVFYTTSYHAIVPNLVDKTKTLETNIALAALLRISPVVSPLIGVSIYAVAGLAGCLGAIGLLFLSAFLLERPISYQSNIIRSAASIGATLRAEFGSFLTLMKSDIRTTSLNFNGLATHLFLFPFLMIGMPIIIINSLHGDPTEYGVVEMCASIGLLVSVLFVPALKYLGCSKNLLIGMIGMFAGSMFFLMLANPEFVSRLTETSTYRLMYFGSVVFIIHLFFGFYGVFFTNYLHENIRKETLGKGMAIQFTLIGIGRMLGFVLFGYLFSLSIKVAVIVLCIGMFLKFIIHVPFLREDARRNLLQPDSA